MENSIGRAPVCRRSAQSVLRSAAAVLLILLLAAGCGKKDPGAAKRDLTCGLDALLGRGETPAWLTAGSGAFAPDALRVLSDSEAGDLILKQVEYEIGEIGIKGKKGEAEIRVRFRDVYDLICRIVENGEAADTDSLLRALTEKLSGVPAEEKTVSAALTYRDGHWFISPDAELLDALTGNLYSVYAGVEEAAFRELEGETEA